jgi:hypothetical protein
MKTAPIETPGIELLSAGAPIAYTRPFFEIAEERPCAEFPTAPEPWNFPTCIKAALLMLRNRHRNTNTLFSWSRTQEKLDTHITQ